MTTLRAQLIRELTLRGSSPRTIESYVAYVADLARHYSQSPDRLSDEQIKAYLFGLHTQRKLSASTINVAVNALRFFYQHVLQRPMAEVTRNLPRPKASLRRPQVYSVAEVERLLTVGCRHLHHRTFLATVYAAGLRLNEACHHMKEWVLTPDRFLSKEELGNLAAKTFRRYLMSHMVSLARPRAFCSSK